jgi:hypothetical protein
VLCCAGTGRGRGREVENQLCEKSEKVKKEEAVFQFFNVNDQTCCGNDQNLNN